MDTDTHGHTRTGTDGKSLAQTPAFDLDAGYAFGRAMVTNENVADRCDRAEEQLLECEHCHESELVVMRAMHQRDGWQFWGHCMTCGMSGPACDSPEEAAAVWNRIRMESTEGTESTEGKAEVDGCMPEYVSVRLTRDQAEALCRFVGDSIEGLRPVEVAGRLTWVGGSGVRTFSVREESLDVVREGIAAVRDGLRRAPKAYDGMVSTEGTESTEGEE